MKKRIVAVTVLFLILCGVLAPEAKGVWVFPSSGYVQSLGRYQVNYFDVKSQYNYLEYERNIQEAYKRGTLVYIFFVSDQDFFYFRNSRITTRFPWTSIQTDKDGFQTFPDRGERFVVITGGGYFASTWYPAGRLDYKKQIDELSLVRNLMLEERDDFRDWEVIDVAELLPQTIKSMRISLPFLAESVKGKKVVYNDDILLYRWFYYMFGREAYAMHFINDPTPMVEGANGNGVGMTIDIDYHIPCDNLVVLNGFVDWDRRHLYKQNARMKKVLVKGDGFEFEHEFEDHVYFSQIDFPKPVTSARLRVLEVYEGERWDDLCISGFFTNPDIHKVRNSPLAKQYLKVVQQEYATGR